MTTIRLLMMLAVAAVLAAPAQDATADVNVTSAAHLEEPDPPDAGDELDQVDPQEQLALARVLVSEVGWEPTAEGAAIHEVLEDRSRRMGLSYLTTLCAYSSRTCDTERADRRSWIAHLRPGDARPEGWPARASWPRHRARWLALQQHAGEVLSGRVESPCSGPVHYWGMPSGIDLRRAQAAGWSRVDCPGARNAFWRVPSRPATG